jgi:hypothetical protein
MQDRSSTVALARFAPIVGAAALALLSGCSTVRGSAVATGPRQPAYSGPVSIYATNAVPAGAVDLGVVEVSASQSESTVGTLLPVFVQKVAQIGGNIAKIDTVRARFELVTRTHLETYYYPCGTRVQCAGQRMYTTNDEIVVVSMLGHAYTDRVEAPAAPVVAPPPPAPAKVEPEAPPAEAPPPVDTSEKQL